MKLLAYAIYSGRLDKKRETKTCHFEIFICNEITSVKPVEVHKLAIINISVIFKNDKDGMLPLYDE